MVDVALRCASMHTKILSTSSILASSARSRQPYSICGDVAPAAHPPGPSGFRGPSRRRGCRGLLCRMGRPGRLHSRHGRSDQMVIEPRYRSNPAPVRLLAVDPACAALHIPLSRRTLVWRLAFQLRTRPRTSRRSSRNKAHIIRHPAPPGQQRVNIFNPRCFMPSETRTSNATEYITFISTNGKKAFRVQASATADLQSCVLNGVPSPNSKAITSRRPTAAAPCT